MSAPARAAARGGARLEPTVAVLARRGRFLVAEPLFERGGRIALEGRAAQGAREGDMVLVGGGKRGLRVVRALGRPDVARDLLEGLMLDRGLRRGFGRAAAVEAGEVAAVPPVERPRHDLRELPTFTIDPTEAKDFDDAISGCREEDGVVRVWVHIADVSAYVRPGGALEREAERRATSVYVPGAVEPMLPEEISNRACSLVPGEDRLTVTVEMAMHGADVRSVRFLRSVIRSDARLTYERADRVLEGHEAAAEPWGEPLAAAREVAQALRERRAAHGALEVESAEPSFSFDGDGHVVGVVHEQGTESHGLIEQLMVLANERVATYLAERRAPTLYRVHERPDPHSVVALLERLASLDVPTPPVPEHMSPQQAGDLVGEISRLVNAHVRRTGRGGRALPSLVLRSLKQAHYSPRNVGHAGLRSPRYCHFTSPIRRYPDLVAHRALLAALGLDDAAPRAEDLEEAGVHASWAEREAMKLERDADDVCRCFLLQRAETERGPGAPWEGEVVGLVGSGAFVSFGPERFEGFLPVRRMRGDWWQLDDVGTALVGQRTGTTVRIGDPVSVEVTGIDVPRGRVDLVPAGEG